jgi:protein-disulfide isomerase
MPAHTAPPAGKGPARPSSRRAARQRDLEGRMALHTTAAAGTAGRSGRAARSLMLWTAVGVVIAVVVIAAAVRMTRQPGDDRVSFSPVAPTAVTPPDIPAKGRTLGDPGARSTIDIYEDFRCTGCYAFRREIEPIVDERYVRTGKARIVFHDFVLIDRFGSTESRDAANAGLCAADQGKFWTMHDWLFANQSPQELPGYFTPDRLVAIGKAAGMDMRSFEPCVREGTHLPQVQAEQDAARGSIHFTPSIFVDGRLVENPDNPQAIPTAEHIGAAIDRNLAPSPEPATR